MKNNVKLTWIQRIKLHLFGHAYLEHRQLPGWRGPLPFHAFKCPTHGIVVDYPHGYWDIGKSTIPVKVDGTLSQLYCPLCEEERRR